MFFLLLLLMLMGLVMLSLNGQHILEKVIVNALLFWDQVAIRTIVLKNLVAHRRRNRMTTIMYAVSLGFIIFLYVSYDVQITSVYYQTQQSHGSYLGSFFPFSFFIFHFNFFFIFFFSFFSFFHFFFILHFLIFFQFFFSRLSTRRLFSRTRTDYCAWVPSW